MGYSCDNVQKVHNSHIVYGGYTSRWSVRQHIDIVINERKTLAIHEKRELAQGEKSVIMVLGSFFFCLKLFIDPLDLLLHFITRKKNEENRYYVTNNCCMFFFCVDEFSTTLEKHGICALCTKFLNKQFNLG